ncbi:hypothetical protein [Amycolatopsis cihanbeyliensis]|nr:hypothetical protein [Amycolatopsis cihanbeyliensis]
MRLLNHDAPPPRRLDLRGPARISATVTDQDAAAIYVVPSCPVDILDARVETEKPVICWEPAVSEYHVWEARVYGADAVLIGARCALFDELYELIENLGMKPIIEVRNERDALGAVAQRARLVHVQMSRYPAESLAPGTVTIARPGLPADVVLVPRPAP